MLEWFLSHPELQCCYSRGRLNSLWKLAPQAPATSPFEQENSEFLPAMRQRFMVNDAEVFQTQDRFRLMRGSGAKMLALWERAVHKR